MSLCRKFAFHWLAVTQARVSQRLAAQQLMLRKDGRPADYHARKRRDRLATRARELRAKPPLFSPFGGDPGAKARFPEKVAFERLEKIRRNEAIAHKPGIWIDRTQGGQILSASIQQAAWHTPPWTLSKQNIFGRMEPQLSSLQTPRHIGGRTTLVSRLALKNPSSVFAQQERTLKRGLGDCRTSFRSARTPSLAGSWSTCGPSPFPAPLQIPKPPKRHIRTQHLRFRHCPPGGRHSEARASERMEDALHPAGALVSLGLAQRPHSVR
jgi:hypothetical protein